MDFVRPSPTHRLYGVEEMPVDEATRFLLPRVAHLYRWWVEAKAGDVPHKHQFDITHHREIVAHIYLVERTEEGVFRFRLHGEEVAELVGRENVGRPVSQDTTAAYGKELANYYETVLTEGRPRRCVGRLAFLDKEWRRFESVDCPLRGDRPGHGYIIGVLDVLRGQDIA